MRRVLLIAVAVSALSACWDAAEEDTTARELLKDTTVIRAGTIAPDSVLGPAGTTSDTQPGDSAAPPATARTRDTAIRVDSTPATRRP
jgi:hypothetical protein